MLKINLRLAIRNIFRNKLYAFINIAGLGIASAFCILVYLYVVQERSFDNFHQDGADLYRVEVSDIFAGFDAEKPKKSFWSFLMTQDVQQQNMLTTPMVMAGALKMNFPEIKNAVRIKEIYDPVVRIGNQSYLEESERCAYVDSDFFMTLDFPFLEGNPATVLSNNSGVVISESIARKYFGKVDPLGKTLNFTNEKVLRSVTGIVKDFPENSSFRFDIVVPRKGDSYYDQEVQNGVQSFSDFLVVKLVKGTNVDAFRKKLDVFAKAYFKPVADDMVKADHAQAPSVGIFLRPFAQAHYNGGEGWGHYTNLANIYQLILLTGLIFLIGCVNYILLTLTSTISSSQNVGIRKTVGAARLHIISQYYIETQILAFVAAIAGFILAIAALPFFNSLTGSTLHLASLAGGSILLMLVAIAIAMGLVAGIYPALAMSGLKPLNIMRNFSAFRLNPILSRIMVTAQFSICILLVISALITTRQMRFVSSAKMGFDTDQVLLIHNPYNWQDYEDAFSLKRRLGDYVASQPDLGGMTTANFDFAGFNSNGHLIGGQRIMIQELNVDYNYLSFNKIPILKGRDFSSDIASDSAHIKLTREQIIPENSTAGSNIIANETLYSLLGKPPLNVINREIGGVIVGVCKDYHTDDLTQAIRPAYHKVSAKYIGYYWIKIKARQNVPQVVDKLRAFWDKGTNSEPFSFTFMDQLVTKRYEAYTRWMMTITTCCLLAIIIACMGLFGLSGITTLNRTKEIGIRKVLGASVSNIFVLLNRGTMVMAAISFVIAAPLAIYLVDQWLENFAYHIKPGWALFAFAAAIAIATAILSVSYHTLKVARRNPVISLRNE